MRPLTQPSKWSFPNSLGWILIFILIISSVFLAAHRILQVDEAQQVFQSVMLAQGKGHLAYVYAPLHHLGPMAWIAHSFRNSADLFFWNRMLYVCLFWGNILLLARICAGTWRSGKVMPWLLLSATLAPLWDYGFEIRHDNLLLTGVLITWLLIRGKNIRPAVVYSLTAAIAVLAQFIAFKSFLYFGPILIALLIVPLAAQPKPHRIQIFLHMLAGAAAGLACVRLMYLLGGGWVWAKEILHGGVATSASAPRFSPLPALNRLLVQLPLITGLAAGNWAVAIAEWRKSLVYHAPSWNSSMPEAVLLAGALIAFLANPTPFPYNLVLLAPFLLISATACWRTALLPVQDKRHAIIFASILVSTHFLPFMIQTYRHFQYTNDRQIQLMNLAEALTDPGTHRVFDGTGMVPTRDPANYNWLLHTLTITKFQDGAHPAVRDQLKQNSTPVIIRNYRTDWLPDYDKQFIHSHYLPLADDFLVLGGVLSAGGGPWQCLHPGRYLIVSTHGASTETVFQLDGAPVKSPAVVELVQGNHDIRCATEERAIIAWVGPKLESLPIVSPSNHGSLFINWY